jgi:hypothetical protein
LGIISELKLTSPVVLFYFARQKFSPFEIPVN